MRISIVLIALLWSQMRAHGQWATMLKDTFSGSRPIHHDLSTKLLWGNQSVPVSAFFSDTLVADDNSLAFQAVGITPLAKANADYTSPTGLKTNVALDFPFPFPVDRNLDSVRVSFDLFWEPLLGVGQSGRVVLGLMHDYPLGGPQFDDVFRFNGHPFGRPAYNIRIMNKNGALNNNLNGVMIHGGGHVRIGELEIFRQGNNKWWLPGFSTEPGGTSPGSTGVFPFGGCAQIRNSQIASASRWRHFTWTIFPEKMILEARNSSDPESNNVQVLQMFIPKVDTLNPGPTVAAFSSFYGRNLVQLPRLYYWFPKLEAFRFFWNAGSNVWLANLKIETTGNTVVTKLKESLSSDLGLIIYPNPGKDRLNIETKSSASEILIVDPFGKQVYRSAAYDQKIGIETSNWSSGLYFIRLSGSNISQRWVKE